MNPHAICHGNLFRGLGTLALPMLVSACLQNLQSVIDLFWVGRLGAVPVAAVALGGTVMMILFPMLLGLSMGTVALVSRHMGQGTPEQAAAVAGQALHLSLLLGGLAAVTGWFFSDAFFTVLGATPEVAAAGLPYLRISLAGSVTVFFLFMGNAALQGAGDAWTPMGVMAAANLANIALDPLFIFGLGPLPPLGVGGAAVATVLAQGLGALGCAWALANGRPPFQVRTAHWRPDWRLSWRILRIGVPGSGQMLSRSLMNALLTRMVAGFGMPVLAAYGIGLRLHMMVLMPAFALGGAAATMVGQNLGAGNPGRAVRAAWLATALDAALMLLAAVALAGWPAQFLRLFTADPAVVAAGTAYLRTVSPFYLFAALGIVLGRALNGAGDTLAPMLITVATLWGLQVPLALLLPTVGGLGVAGVWWAMAAAMLVQGALTTAWFLSNRWRNRQL